MTFKRYLFLSIITLSLLVANGCKGGRWSREWEEKFESFQPSETIMNIIGIREGMQVAEIGAGNGRFIAKVARRVGERGWVFANDINKRALKFMRNRIKRDHITNMVVVEGLVENPLLPEGTLDLIYVINSYSHFRKPVTLLRNAIPALKYGGRLAIIEYDPRKRPDLESHATPQETVIRQAREAGFQVIHIDTTLPIDNIYIFRVKAKSREQSAVKNS